MNKRLQCASRECVHNQNGACLSSAIKVDAIFTEEEYMPYCDTFATRESIIQDPAVLEKLVDISPLMTEFAEEFGVDPKSNRLGCQADTCRFNCDRFCMAPHVKIAAPVRSDSTISMCKTYTKK